MSAPPRPPSGGPGTRVRWGCSALLAAVLVSACSGSSPEAAPSSDPEVSAGPSSAPAATVTSAAPTPPPEGPAPAAPTSAAPVAPPVVPPTDALAPVPSRSLQVEPPVALQSPARLDNGVSVRVTQIDPVTSAGTGPGQVSGEPAVAFHLTLDNGSPLPVSLDLTTVSSAYGVDSTPGLPVDGAPAVAFAGAVPSGGSASAVYVFRIPTADRDQVVLSLRYSVDVPAVTFAGAVP